MTHHGKSLFTMHVLFHYRIHIRYFTLFHFITSRILKIEIIDMNTNYLSLYTSLHFVKRSLFNGKSQFISIPPQMIKTMIHSVIPLYFTIALHVTMLLNTHCHSNYPYGESSVQQYQFFFHSNAFVRCNFFSIS